MPIFVGIERFAGQVNRHTKHETRPMTFSVQDTDRLSPRLKKTQEFYSNLELCNQKKLFRTQLF